MKCPNCETGSSVGAVHTCSECGLIHVVHECNVCGAIWQMEITHAVHTKERP